MTSSWALRSHPSATGTGNTEDPTGCFTLAGAALEQPVWRAEDNSILSGFFLDSFLFGTWVLELKLRSLGFVASAFTQRAIRKSLFSRFPVVPGTELSRAEAWIKLKDI